MLTAVPCVLRFFLQAELCCESSRAGCVCMSPAEQRGCVTGVKHRGHSPGEDQHTMSSYCWSLLLVLRAAVINNDSQLWCLMG